MTTEVSALQTIRGMTDILPTTIPMWQRLENILRTVLSSYAYQEIRTPLLESTALFARSVGEVTDIVEKEMYHFQDRNGDDIALRPEGTAGVIRAGLQHGLFHHQVQRLWYLGPMFRHERPQKGRYRQFFQCGVEVFGISTPDIDAELILLTARLWKALGLEKQVTLQLNTLGSTSARKQYQAALLNYLQPQESSLDPDSQRRLHRNPLRILDSKVPETQTLLKNAPQLTEFLDEEAKVHFSSLCSLLEDNHIAYTLNPHLVRGLDYYCKTVFEWVTTELGAQGTVCGGGRYDGLIEQLGGHTTPGIGFAMGLERLVLLLSEDPVFTQAAQNQSIPHAYLIVLGTQAGIAAMQLAERLRTEVSELRLLTHTGDNSIKSQMKRADQSGARWAFILGENELAQHSVVIKDLRCDNEQQTLTFSALISFLKSAIISL